MAIRNELILELSDLDIISIQCASCDTRVLLSLKGADGQEESPGSSGKKRAPIPTRCPSCGDNWDEIHFAVLRFNETLKSLEQFKVTFHIPTLAIPKEE